MQQILKNDCLEAYIFKLSILIFLYNSTLALNMSDVMKFI